MLYENEEKSQHDTERRIYDSDDILPFPRITVTDPSHSFRMAPYRFPHYDVLSSNRHSEWTQEYRMKKLKNGTVTQSEESITRMTSYRLIQGSWSWPSKGAAGARSAIEDTRLS